MNKQITYTNSAMTSAIDEYIHSKRDRTILKAYYIDGESIDEIANRADINIEARQIRSIIRRCLEALTDYL